MVGRAAASSASTFSSAASSAGAKACALFAIVCCCLVVNSFNGLLRADSLSPLNTRSRTSATSTSGAASA